MGTKSGEPVFSLPVRKGEIFFCCKFLEGNIPSALHIRRGGIFYFKSLPAGVSHSLSPERKQINHLESMSPVTIDDSMDSTTSTKGESQTKPPDILLVKV